MWSYIVNGQQTDHQTAPAVLDLIKSGALPETALVFGPGMTTWKPAIEVRDLLKSDNGVASGSRVSKPGETIALFLQLAGGLCFIAAIVVLFLQFQSPAIPFLFALGAAISAGWAGIVCFWMATMTNLLAELVVQGRNS